MTEPLVSIIIRTKNEEKWISSCLRSVFNQSLKDIEVIVVDNNSTDKTVLKAECFPVKCINVDIFFPGKAINDGVRASKGKYIVCLSGHCIPVGEFWLENLIADLADSNVAGVYGRQEPLSFSSDLDKRDLLIVFGLDKKIQVKDSFFHNANSAFRRDIWNKYPFDEKATNIEDRIWGEKVINAGLNLIYEPKASVYHWHGIHHNLNKDRAKNIVRILEGLDTVNIAGTHQTPEDLKILAVIPIMGQELFLNSRPLMQSTIESAKKSNYISDIVVSTDNESTAIIAKKLGAEVPFIRESFFSEDYIDVFHVLAYTLECLEKAGRHYDAVILLEEIYPFRKDGIIDDIVLQFINGGYDTVLAGTEEDRSIWKTNIDGDCVVSDHDKNPMPSKLKEFKSTISLVGMCSITHVSSLNNGSVFSGEIGISEIKDPLSKMRFKSKGELKIAEIIEKNRIKNNE
jgi:CMP-N-acetylneuraminic acid synthetase